MSEPDLIQQQRTVARMMGGMVNQYFALLDEADTARQSELADVERQHLEKTRELDALLVAFQGREQIARAQVRRLDFKAFDKLPAGPVKTAAEIPARTLAECISEIEHFLDEHTGRPVCLIFVTVPPDVNKTAIVQCLNECTNEKWERCPTSGQTYDCSPEKAECIIKEMESRGVKAALAV